VVVAVDQEIVVQQEDLEVVEQDHLVQQIVEFQLQLILVAVAVEVVTVVEQVVMAVQV
jgi:hypothetical protein